MAVRKGMREEEKSGASLDAAAIAAAAAARSSLDPRRPSAPDDHVGGFAIFVTLI